MRPICTSEIDRLRAESTSLCALATASEERSSDFIARLTSTWAPRTCALSEDVAPRLRGPRLFMSDHTDVLLVRFVPSVYSVSPGDPSDGARLSISRRCGPGSDPRAWASSSAP